LQEIRLFHDGDDILQLCNSSPVPRDLCSRIERSELDFVRQVDASYDLTRLGSCMIRTCVKSMTPLRYIGTTDISTIETFVSSADIWVICTNICQHFQSPDLRPFWASFGGTNNWPFLRLERCPDMRSFCCFINNFDIQFICLAICWPERLPDMSSFCWIFELTDN
jgi:hypothetical protein